MRTPEGFLVPRTLHGAMLRCATLRAAIAYRLSTVKLLVNNPVPNDGVPREMLRQAYAVKAYGAARDCAHYGRELIAVSARLAEYQRASWR